MHRGISRREALAAFGALGAGGVGWGLAAGTARAEGAASLETVPAGPRITLAGYRLDRVQALILDAGLK